MAQACVSTADIRKANRNRIYQLIYRQGSLSKPELASQLCISLPTVIAGVKSLLDDGLIQASGSLESSGGRKATAYSCVDDARLAMGVDITPSHLSAVIVDLRGHIVSRLQMAVPFKDQDEYYQNLGDALVSLTGRAGAEPARILGAGISVPGSLSGDGQRLVHSHILHVENLSCQRMTGFVACPSTLCNDASAAGTSEMWNRAASGQAIYLSLSDSVSGAVFLDRKLYQGDNRRGGEFGHMTVVRGGRRCYCGKNGCLDAYCSAKVLSAPCDHDLAAFFKRLSAGDSKLRQIWDDYLVILAMAINNLRMSFDCDIMIGGSVGAAIGDRIEELRQYAMVINTFGDDGSFITPCCYRQDAAAVGAALQYIEPFIRNP